MTIIAPRPRIKSAALLDSIAGKGFVRVEGADMLALLGAAAVKRWNEFASSWDDLGQDRFMADGGGYRRRRYAAFRQTEGVLVRKPHQPHFQSRDHNALNGDVQRWFEPIEMSVEQSPVTLASVRLCVSLSCALTSGQVGAWDIEFHQFRIEAAVGHPGRPTPEGLHRDGVDWVFVMLVARDNVQKGETELGDPNGFPLGRFTLDRVGDAIFLNDHRILHGVTEIEVIDQSRPGFRDVLVITFSAA